MPTSQLVESHEHSRLAFDPHCAACLKAYAEEYKLLQDNQSKHVMFGQDQSHHSDLAVVDIHRFGIKFKGAPEGAEFFKDSGAIYRDKETIVVCGGTDHAHKRTTNKCFEYSLAQHKYVRLPDMLSSRCSFAIHYEHGKAYAIGGIVWTEESSEIIAKCEAFDFGTMTWTPIADLIQPRYSSQVISYKGELWVMGGICIGRYPKLIERYVVAENKWKIVDFKLNLNLTSFNILSCAHPNEVLLVKRSANKHRRLLRLNLLDQTVVIEKRSFADHYYFYHTRITEEVVLFVDKGNRALHFSLYRMGEGTILEHSADVHPEVLAHYYNMTYPLSPVIVSYKEQASPFCADRDYGAMNLMFGCNDNPFQLEIDSHSGAIDVFPLRTNFPLVSGQGICRISSNELFICGGRHYFEGFNYMNNAMVYNLNAREAKPLPCMLTEVYLPAMCYLDQHIYVIVKKNGVNRPKNPIFTQRYGLETKRWEFTGYLNFKPNSIEFIKHNGQLFVIGTIVSDPSTTIEKFNPKKKRWEICAVMPSNFKVLNPRYYQTDTLLLQFTSLRQFSTYSYDLGRGDLAGLVEIGGKDIEFHHGKHSYVRLRGLCIIFDKFRDGEKSLKYLKQSDRKQAMQLETDSFSFEQVYKSLIEMLSILIGRNQLANYEVITPFIT